MPKRIKRGDVVTLRLSLARDLTDFTDATVKIAPSPGGTSVIDRAGTIDDPPTDGIVSLELTAADYGDDLLGVGTWYMEVELEPGPVTHPDDGFETLRIYQDNG